MKMILETINPYIEFLNLLFSAVIVYFGIRILFKLKGDLRNAWKYFLIAIFLFGFHELIGTFMEFDFFDVEALYSLSELTFIIMFFVSILIFKKLFEGISVSKTKAK